MTVVQRLMREPNLLLGVVVAGLSLLVLFGVDLSKDQLAGIMVFLGALVALVRTVVTPASEVVVQEKPSGEVVAGPAAVAATGTPVVVDVQPVLRR